MARTALRVALDLWQISSDRFAVDREYTQPAIAEERRELLELRKRVKRLEIERDILKKTAAFFAKENA